MQPAHPNAIPALPRWMNPSKVCRYDEALTAIDERFIADALPGFKGHGMERVYRRWTACQSGSPAAHHTAPEASARDTDRQRDLPSPWCTAANNLYNP